MKASRSLLAFLFLLSAVGVGSEQTDPPAPAEGYGKIRGAIVDQNGNQPLAGVIVTLAGTRRGAVTNQNGAFVISRIAPGEHSVVMELIGYARQICDGILVEADETVDLKVVEMKERPVPLKEIVVSPGSYALMGSEPSIRQTLSSEDIEIMGWAEDITRAVQRTPGIVSDEYGAQFSIRGGDVDEVLVLLDGMQIYRPFHQKDFGGGLFSTVDIETVEGVDLLTGGFTADYGDRMSGVLNMKSKSSVDGRRRSSVGVSLMNARVNSMGPLENGRGSYLVSARRGYLDLLNKLMNNEFKLQPSYYDLLGKVDYRLDGNHVLSVHGFLANDTYGLSEKVKEINESTNVDSVDSSYGNNYGWITLKSVFSPELYARTILYGGSVTKRRDWEELRPRPHGPSQQLHHTRPRRSPALWIKAGLGLPGRRQSTAQARSGRKAIAGHLRLFQNNTQRVHHRRPRAHGSGRDFRRRHDPRRYAAGRLRCQPIQSDHAVNG